jgi:hypothetical protein
MANVSLDRKYQFTNSAIDTTQVFTDELAVLGLPSLMYWVTVQAGAPGGIVMFPLFSVTNTTTGGVTAPLWKQFNNGIVLVPGNVTVFTIRASVSVIGMRFDIPFTNPTVTSTFVTAMTAAG